MSDTNRKEFVPSSDLSKVDTLLNDLTDAQARAVLHHIFDEDLDLRSFLIAGLKFKITTAGGSTATAVIEPTHELVRLVRKAKAGEIL
jgi:hypothetical protein